MISIKVENQRFEKALRLHKNAYAATVADTLNGAAKAIESKSRRNAQQRLTIRVPYSINSIRQDRHAKGNDLGRMFSRVGSTNNYMHLHDAGATVQAKKSRLPIPMDAARGGSNRGVIESQYSMRRIVRGKRFFFGVPRGRSGPPGIWERTGSGIRMIRTLSRSSVRIPATRWYRDAESEFTRPAYLERIFMRAARRRLRLFS